MQFVHLFEHQTRIMPRLLATEDNTANFANVVNSGCLANSKPTALANMKFTRCALWCVLHVIYQTGARPGSVAARHLRLSVRSVKCASLLHANAYSIYRRRAHITGRHLMTAHPGTYISAPPVLKGQFKGKIILLLQCKC